MKKMIICALCAMLGIAGIAADTYHVYRFQFTVKSTEAKGVTTVCGCDDYCYREKSSVKIQGVLAGCGCEAINATENCKNAILYMWDATHKVAITNVEVIVPWTVQRIGKKATVIEHFAGIKARYGENDKYGFEAMMSGFGSYKENSKSSELSYVGSISGNIAGIATASKYLKAGYCTACYSEPDEILDTTAFIACRNCSDDVVVESERKDITPFCGTYTVSYDSGKSSNASKNGISEKAFGLPSYVKITDFVATTIGLD